MFLAIIFIIDGGVAHQHKEMPAAKTYPDGGSHSRYDAATKMLVSSAADEQEKAQLEALIIQEFCQERNETNTVSVVVANFFLVQYLVKSCLTLQSNHFSLFHSSM